MSHGQRPPLSLRAGVLWSIVGSTVYLGFQYGMFVAIAKLTSPREVGQFAFAQAVATPIIIIGQLQLRQLQVTDTRAEAKFGHYMSARAVGSLVALMAVLAIAVGGGYRGEMLLIMAFIGAAKAFESMSDIAHGSLQTRERMELIARSQSIKGVVSFMTLWLALLYTDSLVLAVAAMAVVWGLVLVMYDLPLARSVWPGEPLFLWHRDVMTHLVRIGLPLAIASGLLSASANLPRYFLEATRGEEAVGLFTVAAMPLVLLGLVNSSMSQATLARAAVYYHSGRLRLFNRLAFGLSAFHIVSGVLAALVLAAFGGPILRVLFTEEYVSVAPVAAMLAVAVAIGGISVWGNAVQVAGRHFGLQCANVAVHLAVQFPLCWALIEPYGLMGAAWSEIGRTAASTLFLTISGVFIHRRLARAAQ